MKLKCTNRKIGYIAVFLILMITCSTVGWGAKQTENPSLTAAFEADTFKDQQGGSLPYRLLKPLDHSQKLYPLVIFLHGSGERGSDNHKNLNYIAQIFGEPAMRRQYPAFVVVPQCPKGQNWVDRESYLGGVRMSDKPAEPLLLTIKFVQSLKREYPVDPDRVYVVGLSSGGSGTWDLITRYPDWFAAAAPFCGSGDPSKANRLIKIPIWAFHGSLDIVVNPNVTRTMIQAIQKAGGNPKYTEYPGLGHNCWNKTFHNPLFFKWLFAQNRHPKKS